MATIKYNGMERLEEFVSDKPVTFEPAKKMLVWRENSCEPPHEENVLYVNSKYRIVVVLLESGVVKMYEYCAEIPKKPAPRRATWMELAKWCATGNGLVLDELIEKIDTGVIFKVDYPNNPVDDKIKIRKWDDTEWHAPDVEYMGIADVTTFEDVVKRKG